MPNTRRSSPGYELSTMERRYSVPPAPNQGAPPNTSDTHNPPGARTQPGLGPGGPSASEDLHAWSIYRQNLNSDFTDSALGSSEKSPLPYGNFQLRESTVQSILTHPRYGPKSALGANMYTYLKFGLPRVFPPSRGPRDGSSGYDSSDDGSPYLHRQGRNYLRSRSDPDFRNQPLHRPYTGHGPRPLPQPHVGPGWVRTKSNSEANLLSHEVYARHQDHRRSVHDLRVADLQQQSGRLTPSHINDSRHRTSNSSLVHNRRLTTREEAAMGGRLGSVAEAGYAPIPDHIEIGTAFKYPHLQVRGLEVESKSSKHMLLLQGISFEVHGGEIMAVMATAEEEGTGFLEALSGRSSHTGRIRGDVLLNGQLVHSRQLRDRVAYVESDSHLSPDLSVKQTLRFHHWLRRAGDDKSESTAGKTQVQDKIDTLIEDLGLGQVDNIKVSALTTSERRRLNVACHLLLNTDIVVLDQPTKGMDIFDTFFLVEFLRQWSGNSTLPLNAGLQGGRIVILTLHPPTYEIFTMLSRVALVSAGRLMFTGRRRDMLPYFALVQYPCPAYKNPSDYYLDLVTLDDLSAEAMLESSQRIEQLAETFRRHQEPLSDPGPPIALPYKIKRANCLSQMIALLMRALVYTQPVSLLCWLANVLLAVAMSLIVGAIFWDLPGSDPHLVLGDRLGFHYTMTLIAPWPLWLRMSLGEVGKERWAVDHDVRDRLYCRPAYIFTKLVYNLPASALIWMAYIIPAYCMSGLYLQGDETLAIYIYTGFMVLYLLANQMFLTALGYALKHRHVAAILAGLLLSSLTLVSGLPLHLLDVGVCCQWLGTVSPARWILPVLLQREYSPLALSSSTSSLTCKNKHFGVQHQDIIVQGSCLPPNGTAVLQYVHFLPDPRQPEYMAPVAVAVFWFLCYLVASGSFLVSRYQPVQPRNNPNKP